MGGGTTVTRRIRPPRPPSPMGNAFRVVGPKRSRTKNYQDKDDCMLAKRTRELARLVALARQVTERYVAAEKEANR